MYMYIWKYIGMYLDGLKLLQKRIFLGLNEPDIDDLLKVAKSRQITGTGIFCYYIVSTHTIIHVYLQ